MFVIKKRRQRPKTRYHVHDIVRERQGKSLYKTQFDDLCSNNAQNLILSNFSITVG